MRLALIPIVCLLGCYGSPPTGLQARASAIGEVSVAAKKTPPPGVLTVVDANGVTLGKLIQTPFSSSSSGGFMSWIDADNIIWVIEFSGDPTIYFFNDSLLYETPDCTGTPYENATPPIANIGITSAGQSFRSTGMRSMVSFQSIKNANDSSCSAFVTTISAAPVVPTGAPSPSLPAEPLSIVPAS